MDLQIGELPSLDDFEARARGTHDLLLHGESIYYVTGAVNQGLDEDLIAVGAVGTWIDRATLKLTICDSASLYSLLRRLLDIHIAFPDEFEHTPAALVRDILDRFGYCWVHGEEQEQQQIQDAEVEAVIEPEPGGLDDDSPR